MNKNDCTNENCVAESDARHGRIMSHQGGGPKKARDLRLWLLQSCLRSCCYSCRAVSSAEALQVIFSRTQCRIFTPIHRRHIQLTGMLNNPTISCCIAWISTFPFLVRLSYRCTLRQWALPIADWRHAPERPTLTSCALSCRTALTMVWLASMLPRRLTFDWLRCSRRKGNVECTIIEAECQSTQHDGQLDGDKDRRRRPSSSAVNQDTFLLINSWQMIFCADRLELDASLKLRTVENDFCSCCKMTVVLMAETPTAPSVCDQQHHPLISV